MSTGPIRRHRRGLRGRISRFLALAALLVAAGLGARVAPQRPGAPAAPAPAAPGRYGQPAPRPAFVPPAAEALVAGEVDQARMQATVRELVRLGPRMGGTPSGARAAA
ncbi:MAG TPA: hypothetical protein VN999_02265, partial [Thermoanaerobaculia bacterium]|nr:hypothetical protein [Thermoanaerobaculia bacterium]